MIGQRSRTHKTFEVTKIFTMLTRSMQSRTSAIIKEQDKYAINENRARKLARQ
jgi:hypothetical protein